MDRLLCSLIPGTLNGSTLQSLLWLLAFFFLLLSGIYAARMNSAGKRMSRKRQERRLFRQQLTVSMQGSIPKSSSDSPQLAKKPQLEEARVLASAGTWVRFAKKCATITETVKKRVRRSVDNSQGTTRGVWAPVWFVLVIIGGIAAYFVIYPPDTVRPADFLCPENCTAIQKVEGVQGIEGINLKTGRVNEFRWCRPYVDPNYPKLFPGYVIELHTVRRGFCDDITPPTYYFHIVRGKELKKAAYQLVSAVTRFDGDDRPALSNRCHNTEDDTNVICEGQPFVPTQEESHSEPTGRHVLSASSSY
jgi:hypothetical protein